MAVLRPDIEPAMAPETKATTWTCDDPHLSGNGALTGPEIDTAVPVRRCSAAQSCSAVVEKWRAIQDKTANTHVFEILI
ncbi:MAG TPA: hypothetical protein VIU82_14465 [Bosea sp. (in: a-proteobacteria)]